MSDWRRVACLAVAGGAVAGLVAPAGAEHSHSWRLISADPLEYSLSSSAVVYDRATHQTLLVTNKTSGGVPSETWVLSGRGWSQLTAAKTPDGEPTVVYDEARRTVVLISNSCGGTGTDCSWTQTTWLWSGKSWVRPRANSPVQEPPGRSRPNIAYDAKSRSVVLFGGCTSKWGCASAGYRSDTWTWNGSSWSPVSGLSPPARALAGLAYDAATREMVLVGGIGGKGPLGDTWVFDGRHWRQHASQELPVREKGGLVYDAATKQLLLFGGDIGGYPTKYLADTWVWAHGRWSQGPAGPAPSSDTAIVYAAAHHRVVLVGGRNANGAIPGAWLWNGRRWQRGSELPPARSGADIVYDEAGKQVVVTGGTGEAGLGDTWIWDGRHWNGHSGPGGAYSLTNMIYDGASHKVCVFAGYNVTSYAAQPGVLYTLESAAWRAHVESPGPIARQGATFVYDEATKQALLFGGQYNGPSGAVYLNDTWLWTGKRWIQYKGNGPGPRSNASAAYDAATGEVVLFGGQGPSQQPAGNGVLNDTWTWSGGKWQLRDQGGPGPSAPSPRLMQAFAYDPASKQIVLFGGISQVSPGTDLGDTWLWSGRGWSSPAAGISTVTGPGPRNASLTVYDGVTRKLLLIGGEQDGFGMLGDAHDVWGWNGTTWSRISNGGGPEAMHSVATYDPDTRQVVVLSTGKQDGLSDVNSQGTVGGQAKPSTAWVWDGRAWSQTIGPYASNDDAGPIVFDAAGHRIVAYGALRHTWSW